MWGVDASPIYQYIFTWLVAKARKGKLQLLSGGAVVVRPGRNLDVLVSLEFFSNFYNSDFPMFTCSEIWKIGSQNVQTSKFSIFIYS